MSFSYILSCATQDCVLVLEIETRQHVCLPMALNPSSLMKRYVSAQAPVVCCASVALGCCCDNSGPLSQERESAVCNLTGGSVGKG